MVAGNKKNRSFRRVGHDKGDGYALQGFEERQNCRNTRGKSRGRLRRCSSRTPSKEEFGQGANRQQDAEQGHHSGLADGTGEEGKETVPEPQKAGREEETEHDAPLRIRDFGNKKRRKQRSPALRRPPESHEHQDVVPANM